MLYFGFLEIGLGLLSWPRLVWYFKKKRLMLYCTNWPGFIVWMSLVYKISKIMSIVIVYYPACEVVNFEIYLSFLVKPFSFMIQKPEQKFKYLTKWAFRVKWKSIFHHFKAKGLSVRKLSQTWECSFN